MKKETLRNLKELLVALLATPQSDDALIDLLIEKDIKEIIKSFHVWLKSTGELNNRMLVDDISFIDINCAQFTLIKPIKSKVGVICTIGNKSLELQNLEDLISENNFEFLIYLSTNKKDSSEVKNISKLENVLFINVNWLTSIVIENSLPFFAQLGGENHEWEQYIKKKTEHFITVNQSEDNYFFLDKKNTINKNSELYNGNILLCTSFLPSVTFSISAVKRFYENSGMSKENLSKVVLARLKKVENWKMHINNFNRYDIVDRQSLKEYFSNPEYFQMGLQEDEMMEQISNIEMMLKYQNYNLCLTPETVDISYEIRKPDVYIRTDRRNKTKPKVGRISNIRMTDEAIANKFENEFWSKYNHTPNEFKDKDYILSYIKNLFQNKYYHYKKELLKIKYDALILYAPLDKNCASKLAYKFQRMGTEVWFDEWNSKQDHQPWQETLNGQIEKVNNLVILIGRKGLGHFLERPYDEFLKYFIKQRRKIIPLILPDTNIDLNEEINPIKNFIEKPLNYHESEKVVENIKKL